MIISEIITKLKSDKAFAEKYAALSGVDAILEQMKKDGYDVTREDVEAAILELSDKTGELSEADLAAVAGGGGSKKCSSCGRSYTIICACSPSRPM